MRKAPFTHSVHCHNLQCRRYDVLTRAAWPSVMANSWGQHSADGGVVSDVVRFDRMLSVLPGERVVSPRRWHSMTWLLWPAKRRPTAFHCQSLSLDSHRSIDSTTHLSHKRLRSVYEKNLLGFVGRMETVWT